MIPSLSSLVSTDQILFLVSSMDVDNDHITHSIYEKDDNADTELIMESEEVPWQGHYTHNSEGLEVGAYLILLFC